jgi:hypothetical protein
MEYVKIKFSHHLLKQCIKGNSKKHERDKKEARMTDWESQRQKTNKGRQRERERESRKGRKEVRKEGRKEIKNKCEVWGSHDSDYVEYSLLGCDVIVTDVPEEHTVSIFRVEGKSLSTEDIPACSSNQ